MYYFHFSSSTNHASHGPSLDFDSTPLSSPHRLLYLHRPFNTWCFANNGVFFFFFLILQELTGYLELALFSFLFLIPRYSLICTLHREDNYSFRIGKWLFH